MKWACFPTELTGMKLSQDFKVRSSLKCIRLHVFWDLTSSRSNILTLELLPSCTRVPQASLVCEQPFKGGEFNRTMAKECEDCRENLCFNRDRRWNLKNRMEEMREINEWFSWMTNVLKTQECHGESGARQEEHSSLILRPQEQMNQQHMQTTHVCNDMQRTT